MTEKPCATTVPHHPHTWPLTSGIMAAYTCPGVAAYALVDDLPIPIYADPADLSAVDSCECPPCPGRGTDGHGMTHCAECCFGTGIDADPACPIHGYMPDSKTLDYSAIADAVWEGEHDDN